MIAKESPIVLDTFDILQSDISIIFNADINVNLLQVTKEYPVDIDFYTIAQNEDSFAIYTKVTINHEKKPGYSIFAEGAGLFSIDKSVSDNDRQKLINSGINICITNLRAYISTVTAFYPLGRFSFHSVDMQALFKSKLEQQEKQSSDKP